MAMGALESHTSKMDGSKSKLGIAVISFHQPEKQKWL
jgi:hypothetical protein